MQTNFALGDICSIYIIYPSYISGLNICFAHLWLDKGGNIATVTEPTELAMLKTVLVRLE